MISQDRQKIKSGPNDTSRASGAHHLFRLSATMVELSLRHKQPESPTDVATKPPTKIDRHLAEARGQLISGIMASTPAEKGRRSAQFHHSELVHAGRELLRTFAFRISHQRVKTFAWLTGIAAVALMALLIVAFHQRSDNGKSQSQAPAMLQQPERPLVPSSASQKTQIHAETVAPKKTKPRHQADYIAQDTYIYYGKDGKPSH